MLARGMLSPVASSTMTPVICCALAMRVESSSNMNNDFSLFISLLISELYPYAVFMRQR